MKMKGNLISSISIIFILLVSMAMTGCATPLHIAAARGDINAVKALLEQRADVNKRDKNSSTPLHEAASKGHANIVRLLIEKGADVNAKSKVGHSPLHLAAFAGSLESVRLLVEKGADINATLFTGATPLHNATYNEHVEIVRLLIEKGADINATLSDGTTPLTSAVIFGRASVVSLLLEKGADTTITATLPSLGKKTPLEIAEKFNKTIITKMIREAGKKQNEISLKVEKKQSAEIIPTSFSKSDVDELPSIKAKPNKNSYAIVIGIEQYRQKLPKADFATQDAKTMTEYLTKVMGYPEENVVTLMNDRASLTDFIKYFEKWLPNNVEKDSSVFIYYSGHGAPNTKTGDAYLVPYDGDPSFIDETGYSLKRLYESLGKLQAKEIIVALDSCFSGAGGRSVLAKGARPLVMTMEKSVVPSNVAVLSAASGEQISSTYEEKGHGLFTYFMLKGIKSEGDTNGDGKVEIGELFEYIKPQVERIARKVYNNEQLPQLIAPVEKQRIFLKE